MRVTHMTPDRQEEWNKFVAQEPSFALFQSWEWGEFKEKLGWKVYRVAVERQGNITAGAQILIKSLPLGVAGVAYIPRGPIGNWFDENIVTSLLSELHHLARNHKTIFLKIEPPLMNKKASCQIFQKHDFQTSHFTNQPQATIVLDLTSDLDDILKQMRKKTRQYIRQAIQKDVKVRVGGQKDIPAFYELMQITGRRGNFIPRTFEYYEHEQKTFMDTDQTVLLMAFCQDQLLAVRTAYQCGDHAAEFHAGSLDEYTNLRANYLLVWEAIKWAKTQGCRTYDLWGIPDEVGQAVSEGKNPPVSNRTDGLWGVYRFKRGFSKNIVCYVGAYDYVYSPLLYTLISNRFFNTNTLNRAAIGLDSLRNR